jgi:hypothetical protein
MTRDEAEALRANPRYWTIGIIYRCPDDPRVIVRERLLPGWTFNFGHRFAIPTLLAFVLIAIGPFLWVLTSGLQSVPALLAVAGMSAIVLISIAHRIASGPR